MIDLYYWPTPNGRKVSILLEEIAVPYKIIRVDITKEEQFSKSFTSIAPSNKIPAIFDHETNQHLFESSTILFYLAKKYNRFLPQNKFWEIQEWLIFQTSQVGPLLGQAHQFLYYFPGKSKFAEEKYINYGKRIYETLERRLENKDYLVHEYSIADIATWPWIARHERHKINIHDYRNVLRWYKSISKRPAVIKGYNPDGENEKIPLS
jgi:GST-like protein